jgi:hypothetical protein
MGRSTSSIVVVAAMLAACRSSDDTSGSSVSGQGGSAANGAGAGGSGMDAGGVSGSGGASGAGSGGSIAGASGAGGSVTEPLDGATGDGETTTPDAGTDASVPPPADGGDAQTGEIGLFPVNGSLDYQLGGAYPPPTGVTIVTRDRNDAPAAGLYNICYINGYQTQPGEEGQWEADLILRDGSGDPVIDPNWGEMLLDVSTADKRTRIAEKVGGWIEKCAADGFDAVEIDNLDTYSRSGGRITQDNAVAFMALLSGAAHASGLAIAQKNSTEILHRRVEMQTDFAVAEECSVWNECGEYVDAYGSYVLMIEYDDGDFAQGCSQYGATHPIVRRGLYLLTPGNQAYVFDGC